MQQVKSFLIKTHREPMPKANQCARYMLLILVLVFSLLRKTQAQYQPFGRSYRSQDLQELDPSSQNDPKALDCISLFTKVNKDFIMPKVCKECPSHMHLYMNNCIFNVDHCVDYIDGFLCGKCEVGYSLDDDYKGCTEKGKIIDNNNFFDLPDEFYQVEQVTMIVNAVRQQQLGGYENVVLYKIYVNFIKQTDPKNPLNTYTANQYRIIFSHSQGYAQQTLYFKPSQNKIQYLSLKTISFDPESEQIMSLQEIQQQLYIDRLRRQINRLLDDERRELVEVYRNVSVRARREQSSYQIVYRYITINSTHGLAEGRTEIKAPSYRRNQKIQLTELGDQLLNVMKEIQQKYQIRQYIEKAQLFEVRRFPNLNNSVYAVFYKHQIKSNQQEESSKIYKYNGNYAERIKKKTYPYSYYLFQINSQGNKYFLAQSSIKGRDQLYTQKVVQSYVALNSYYLPILQTMPVVKKKTQNTFSVALNNQIYYQILYDRNIQNNQLLKVINKQMLQSFNNFGLSGGPIRQFVGQSKDKIIIVQQRQSMMVDAINYFMYQYTKSQNTLQMLTSFPLQSKSITYSNNLNQSATIQSITDPILTQLIKERIPESKHYRPESHITQIEEFFFNFMKEGDSQLTEYVGYKIVYYYPQGERQVVGQDVEADGVMRLERDQGFQFKEFRYIVDRSTGKITDLGLNIIVEEKFVTVWYDYDGDGDSDDQWLSVKDQSNADLSDITQTIQIGTLCTIKQSIYGFIPFQQSKQYLLQLKKQYCQQNSMVTQQCSQQKLLEQQKQIEQQKQAQNSRRLLQQEDQSNQSQADLQNENQDDKIQPEQKDEQDQNSNLEQKQEQQLEQGEADQALQEGDQNMSNEVEDQSSNKQQGQQNQDDQLNLQQNLQQVNQQKAQQQDQQQDQQQVQQLGQQQQTIEQSQTEQQWQQEQEQQQQQEEEPQKPKKDQASIVDPCLKNKSPLFRIISIANSVQRKNIKRVEMITINGYYYYLEYRSKNSQWSIIYMRRPQSIGAENDRDVDADDNIDNQEAQQELQDNVVRSIREAVRETVRNAARKAVKKFNNQEGSPKRNQLRTEDQNQMDNQDQIQQFLPDDSDFQPGSSRTTTDDNSNQ